MLLIHGNHPPFPSFRGARLSPAMGDRIVEIGTVICQGDQEINRLSRLVNPERTIPSDAYRVHGISDEDVSSCPVFKEIAEEIESTLIDSWIVGHNVGFDVGFVAMEMASSGHQITPLGCLDTCQLAKALWDLPNFQLGTVVRSLKIPVERQHRALDDALLTRAVFSRVVDELGGWDALTIDDLMRLHRYEPSWPSDPKGDLPKSLYDALTNGASLSIRYVNAAGQSSSRIIHPETSFDSGRYTYIRAFCEKSSDVRTFRLDRIIVE